MIGQSNYSRTSIKRPPIKRPPSIKRPLSKVPNYYFVSQVLYSIPLFNGQPLLSGQFSKSPGWPLNRGPTVLWFWFYDTRWKPSWLVELVNIVGNWRSHSLFVYVLLFNNLAFCIAVFSDAGIDLSKPVICMCFSGMSSCTLVLAAYLCGCPDTAVYLVSYKREPPFWQQIDVKWLEIMS